LRHVLGMCLTAPDMPRHVQPGRLNEQTNLEREQLVVMRVTHVAPQQIHEPAVDLNCSCENLCADRTAKNRSLAIWYLAPVDPVQMDVRYAQELQLSFVSSVPMIDCTTQAVGV
jgi:hypothetical protein